MKAAVNSFSAAKAVGHKSPSPRFVACMRANVAYLKSAGKNLTTDRHIVLVVVLVLMLVFVEDSALRTGAFPSSGSSGIMYVHSDFRCPRRA